MKSAGKKSFNPYRKWLGIPEGIRKPNHYQILGIAEFESDRDVIQNAVDRQMAHVRTFQRGKNSKWCQKILNEITRAKLCLLDPEEKRTYDSELKSAKSGLESGAPQPPPVAPPPPPVPPATGSPAEDSAGPRIRVSGGPLQMPDEVPHDARSPMDPFQGPLPSRVSAVPNPPQRSVVSRVRHRQRKSSWPTIVYVMGVVAGVLILGLVSMLFIGQ